MDVTPAPFQVSDLMSSVTNVVSRHSANPGTLIDVHINDQVPRSVIADFERIQQALIIVVERSLIQQPGVPIQLSCALIRRSQERATVCFTVKQDLTDARAALSDGAYRGGTAENFGEDYEEMSIQIANRIIGECGGRFRHSALDQVNGVVFFWVPVGLRTAKAYSPENPTVADHSTTLPRS